MEIKIKYVKKNKFDTNSVEIEKTVDSLKSAITEILKNSVGACGVVFYEDEILTVDKSTASFILDKYE